MKSGFIRKEADLICLFGSLREKRARAQDGLRTDERVERRQIPLIGLLCSVKPSHWPILLIVQSCGEVIVKHNIEFLQNKETIGRKHNNLGIKTTSFPGAT